MIDGFPLSFFLPLVVHALAGLTTGVTGEVAFRAPKRRGRQHRWGTYYLWAYTVVFFTATILSVQRWPGMDSRWPATRHDAFVGNPG